MLECGSSSPSPSLFPLYIFPLLSPPLSLLFLSFFLQTTDTQPTLNPKKPKKAKKLLGVEPTVDRAAGGCTFTAWTTRLLSRVAQAPPTALPPTLFLP